MSTLRTVSQTEAAQIDEQLMGTYQIGLEQLMEVAGLAVAQAVPLAFPSSIHRIVVVCGPGNNGGDGLVAARYLHGFGFQVSVVYPKHSSHPHLIVCSFVNHLLSNFPIFWEKPQVSND